MKLLVDMNLSPVWVDYLAKSGIEAVHWSQVGAPDAPDSDVMRWAADHGYVVLTADLDFGAILAATQTKQPSVLQLRSDVLNPAVIGPAILAAVRQTRQELTDGALVSIDAARSRLRILPLGSDNN
jgi:predicted nuclease of predicted toxin-antitoxin system